MSAADISAETMALFAPLAAQAHLTIVLGAGASVPSGLPTWDDFARALVVRSGLAKNLEAATVLLGKQDPTIVLEAARARSGDRWEAHLSEALYGDLPAEPQPSPLHRAAAHHLVSRPDQTTLATLNFDTLLEFAVADTTHGNVALSINGAPDAHLPTVHHLHGAVFDDEALQPVVSFRDFAELVSRPDAWQRSFLSDALRRGPLLLAGTSYRDPDIRHWLHVILRDESPDYRPFVTIAREGLSLDRADFELIREGLALEWESIGLSAVTMEDLTDIAHVLRELTFTGTDDYVAPQVRTRRLWDAHRRDFARHQAAYSEVLDADTSRVEEALGARAHRGTIWIADGQSHIARWATADGVFSSVDRLKLVPTGHDSPWIAGEALSAEEVRIRDVSREQRIRPTWRSVLAVPIAIGDGRLPPVASAVVTYGMTATSATLVSRGDAWRDLAVELSNEWAERLSAVAYPDGR